MKYNKQNIDGTQNFSTMDDQVNRELDKIKGSLEIIAVTQEVDINTILTGDIKGSTQDTVFSGTEIESITHKIDGATVRVDTFTYETNKITELRTATSGETLTYIYHLDTMQTEII